MDCVWREKKAGQNDESDNNRIAVKCIHIGLMISHVNGNLFAHEETLY